MFQVSVIVFELFGKIRLTCLLVLQLIVNIFLNRTSELMYDVLDESLRRAEINHNITYGG